VRSATRLYGVFVACGSLGAALGALVVDGAEKTFGTPVLYLVPVATLTAVAVAGAFLRRWVGRPAPAAESASRSDLKMFRASPLLLWLLGFVVLTQITINVIEIGYSFVLKAEYGAEVTRVMGRINAVLNVTALILPLFTGPILRALGTRGTLAINPVVLFALALGFVVHPAFVLVALLRISSKGFDYTLSRAAKEILYIPLG
jgi:ATP/ADP translocase